MLDTILPLQVYETSVGLKYRNGSFGGHFTDWVVEEKTLKELDESLDSFFLPPDLLLDEYTLCGRPITESPHVGLMRWLDEGMIEDKPEYIRRQRCGTLDARPQADRSPQVLMRSFRRRVEQLRGGGQFSIYAIHITTRGQQQYVIGDGKHRAALAYHLGRTDQLQVNLISPQFSNDPFFRKVYSAVLKRSSRRYSINQEWIKSILNERRIMADRAGNTSPSA